MRGKYRDPIAIQRRQWHSLTDTERQELRESEAPDEACEAEASRRARLEALCAACGQPLVGSLLVRDCPRCEDEDRQERTMEAPYNALCLLCTGDSVAALLHRAARRDGVLEPHRYPEIIHTLDQLAEALGWPTEERPMTDD